MLSKRIIPCLLLDGDRLVKTIKFTNPSYIGDPINAVKIFNEKEVDELVILNISSVNSSSIELRALLHEMLTEAFMPITFGGGVDSLEYASQLFRMGVEKISLGRLALIDPGIVKNISDRYGAQAISICIDVKRDFFGGYMGGSFRGGEALMFPISDVLKKIEKIDYGELIINNVDRDGTLKGLDCKLVKQVSELTDRPLLVSGGAKSLQDIATAFDNGADAVMAGSMFVYAGVHRAVLLSYPTQEQIDHI